MKLKTLIALIVLFTNFCQAQSVKHPIHKYLFYLHGQILEEQGAKAVSPQYGAYQYQAILDSFRQQQFEVISEVRKKDTDVKEYAKKITAQIDSLIKCGIKPQDITVVGASKGSIIAMYVSTFLKNNGVNFVLLAGCHADILQQQPDIRFYGNILSIYEKSDNIGHSCAGIKGKSLSTITHYKEIEINTGKAHGFLYSPMIEWIEPAIRWANGKYE